MMKNFCGLMLIVLVLGLINGEDFVYPTNLKRCPFGKSDCLVTVIEEYLEKSAVNGIKEIGLVSMDPFLIKEIIIDQGKDSPVNIKLTVKDCQLTGLSKAKLIKVSGFDENPLTTKVNILVKMPLAELIGKYTINGNILILPIQGDGDVKISFRETNIGVQFQFEENATRNGKIFVKVKNVKITIDPKKVRMNFSNLFNGDKLLGDTTNLFLNENGKEIFDEIKPGLIKSLTGVVKSTVNEVYDKVPYAETFSNN